MTDFLRTVTTYVVCAAFLLSSCVSATGSGGVGLGPQLSSLFDSEEEGVAIDPDKPKLDIIIPVFDPGLGPDKEDVETTPAPRSGRSEPPAAGKSPEPSGADIAWPELRRAEANRFAYKLKLALEDTGAFGAVRVTPDKTATGDVYLLGTIEESDGENVEIDIGAFDISGNRWFEKSFDHSVDENYHGNYRNKGKDPYDPVFAEIAQYVLEQLRYRDTEELRTIKRITDLRFAASFSDAAFADYLDVSDGKYHLTAYPSSEDPMLAKTQAVRVRDQLFVDGLQQNYRLFSEEMETSYLIWQEQSQLELQAKREAQYTAAGEAVAGVLLIGLAVLAIAAGAESDDANTRAAATTAGTLAGTAGGVLLAESWQSSKEAEIHVDALEELGQSIDMELAPQVVAFEEKTVELTGTAGEQFAQWRAFLKKIYDEESVPDVQL